MTQEQRDYYDERPRECGGTLYNGPGKRFVRCYVCGRIDYEANEGDRCRALSRPRKGRKDERCSPKTM